LTWVEPPSEAYLRAVKTNIEQFWREPGRQKAAVTVRSGDGIVQQEWSDPREQQGNSGISAGGGTAVSIPVGTIRKVQQYLVRRGHLQGLNNPVDGNMGRKTVEALQQCLKRFESVQREMQHRLNNSKHVEYGHSFPTAAGTTTTYYQVDEQQGVYRYDCSGLHWHVLSAVAKHAFQELKVAMQIKPGFDPGPDTLLLFFQRLRTGAIQSEHWQIVEEPGEIRPGDVLVKASTPADASTGIPGHVMIAMERGHIGGSAGNSFIKRAATDGSTQYSLDIAHSTNGGQQRGVIVIQHRTTPVAVFPEAHNNADPSITTRMRYRDTSRTYPEQRLDWQNRVPKTLPILVARPRVQLEGLNNPVDGNMGRKTIKALQQVLAWTTATYCKNYAGLLMATWGSKQSKHWTGFARPRN
jgi:hypothetical protein